MPDPPAAPARSLYGHTAFQHYMVIQHFRSRRSVTPEGVAAAQRGSGRRRAGDRQRPVQATRRWPGPEPRRDQRWCWLRRCRAATSPPHARQSRQRNSRWDETRTRPCNAVRFLLCSQTLFSEWISCNDESMSSTTPPPQSWPSSSTTPRRAHQPLPPTAPLGCRRRAGGIHGAASSNGTDPNNTLWERNCSMSVHASPPPASINSESPTPRRWEPVSSTRPEKR